MRQNIDTGLENAFQDDIHRTVNGTDANIFTDHRRYQRLGLNVA
jgi:hypothetical protein